MRVPALASFVAAAVAAAVTVTGAAGCKKVGPGLGVAAPDGPSARGAMLYQRLCALCHGDHAEGYKADNAPSLVNPTFLASASDTFLRSSIAIGRKGTAMAGYAKSVGGPLEPADVDALIAFLRKDAPPPAEPPAPPRGDVQRGQLVYLKQCATCHGIPGQRAQFVYLASPAFLAAASDGFLAEAIAHGRPGTKMAAWQGTLDAQQIGDVVAFVRAWPTTEPAPPALHPNEPKVPSDLPIVINPDGKAPEFPALKEDRYLPAAEVKKALDDHRRLIIVDARPPSDWLGTHIPGAISIPYYDMKMIDQLPTDGTWVLTYCACPHHASGIVLDELRKRGFKNSAVIDEGILGWQRAGFPAVDVDGKPAALPPQLQAPPPPPAPPPAPPAAHKAM